MRHQYRIITDGLKLDEVLLQIKSIKNFPATIALYDRVFLIDSEDGIYGLTQGLEIGFYFYQELEK